MESEQVAMPVAPERLTVWRCPDHGLRVKPLGRGREFRVCDFYVTNAQCRKHVEPVEMIEVTE